MQQTKTIEVTINGKKVTGRQGMTILDLAKESGVDIPTLCYSPELRPIGACRLCVVEVEGSRTLVAACYTPIANGNVIQTHSPKVIEARKAIVELMLASHPDVCLVCNKANICELRRIATDLEVGLPRFRTTRHYYPVEDLSPYLVRDMSKCVMCRRCVRACAEIAKKNIFSVAYRGFNSKVVADCDEPVNTEACKDCNVCVEFCPTGSLTKPRQVTEERKGKVQFVKS